MITVLSKNLFIFKINVSIFKIIIKLIFDLRRIMIHKYSSRTKQIKALTSTPHISNLVIYIIHKMSI